MQDRPPAPNNQLFTQGVQDLPKHFLDKTVSFYPDRFDLSQQPGLKIGTVCHGVSYKVIKQTYGEYEVPDKAFVQASLSVYEGAIRLNDSVRTWQGHKTLSDVDKHALLPFDERGWIRVRIQTRCAEPGQKPDNSWEDYEISKGGMLSNYLVDGIFLLKKISDQPAAPGSGSLPKVDRGTRTIQTQKPAAVCMQARSSTEKAICDQSTFKKLDTEMADAYHRVFANTQPNSLARKALIDAQRQWHQNRDACASDVGCLQGQYQERLQALQQGYLDQYEKARKAAEAH